MYETTYKKGPKGFSTVSDSCVSYWPNGQLQTFCGIFCSLLLLSPLSFNVWGKTWECVSVSPVLTKKFQQHAESSPIMGFREKYVTEIGCWHFICIEFIGIKFTKILGMPINLLWAIAFLVINPFCHSLHSVPAKLPAFQCAKTMCQKSAEAVVYNWEKKWPIKFRRALETNLCKSEYITISERQQALQYFYCYLTSQ